MEQTDYLLRQINRLTNLLQQLLSNILKLKDENRSECLQLIQKNLKEIIGKDAGEIGELSNEKLMEIIDEKKMSRQGKINLTEILEIAATLLNKAEQKKLSEKILFIYEDISKIKGDTFSIELNLKMEAIYKQLTE